MFFIETVSIFPRYKLANVSSYHQHPWIALFRLYFNYPSYWWEVCSYSSYVPVFNTQTFYFLASHRVRLSYLQHPSFPLFSTCISSCLSPGSQWKLLCLLPLPGSLSWAFHHLRLLPGDGKLYPTADYSWWFWPCDWPATYPSKVCLLENAAAVNVCNDTFSFALWHIQIRHVIYIKELALDRVKGRASDFFTW